MFRLLMAREDIRTQNTTQAIAWLMQEPMAPAASCSFAAKVGDSAEWERQADLLRCIFGNPFRPVILSPSCLTPAVKTLAEQIYNDRAFDRMPVLGDALEVAGCTVKEVLEHCRNGGEHVRGCWVIDKITGRE
jgi:hypothetical protein